MFLTTCHLQSQRLALQLCCNHATPITTNHNCQLALWLSGCLGDAHCFILLVTGNNSLIQIFKTPLSQRLSTHSRSIPYLSLPIPPLCCYSLWLSSSLLFSRPFSKSRNPLAMILPMFQSSSLLYFCVPIFLSYHYPLVVYCYLSGPLFPWRS